MKLTAVLLAGAAMLAATPALADTFNTEASFDAANKVTSTVSFTGLTNYISAEDSPLNVDGTTFTGNVLYATSTNFWGSKDSLLDDEFSGAINFTFSPAQAVGFYLAGGYLDSPVDLSFYNGENLIYSTTQIGGGVDTQFSFFGVNNIGNITGARIDTTAYPNGFASVGPISYSAASATGAVPEPATWAMMMVGFGMIGFGLRRRSKVSTTVRFA